MKQLEILINEAVANPSNVPDPIVPAILQNDLCRTIECATEYGLTLRDLDRAVRHVKSRITGSEIKAFVKKWGKK